MSKQSRLNKQKAEKAKANQDKQQGQPNQQRAQDGAQDRSGDGARKNDRQ